MRPTGGTSVEAGLVEALDTFEDAPYYEVDGRQNSKLIVLLCDGDVYYTSDTLKKIKDNHIKVYPVLIGSTWGQASLETLANETGGTFYYAATAEEIREAMWGVQEEIIGEIDTTDTDEDGLYDIYETAGMMIPNGQVIYTDPNDPDSDDDGLDDDKEMGIPEKKYILTDDYEIEIIDIICFKYKSNPNNEDTDSDGLLDGRARYVNGKKIAPKDPSAIKVNGPEGIWKAQLEQELRGDIPNEYGGWYDIDWSDWDTNGWPSALTGLGSYVLMFRYDNLNKALHSDASNWQQIGGYNKVYDAIFKIGTGGNMDNVRFKFTCGLEDYVVWAWRGSYLNLGSGAEIGVYTNPHTLPVVGIEQWDVVNFTLPMTLNLYNYYSKNDIENIFCWAPNAEQWWITGFNPEFDDPKAKKMVSLGSIDFVGREDMFQSLKGETEINKENKDFMIFDDDGHTVWFIWWE